MMPPSDKEHRSSTAEERGISKASRSIELVNHRIDSGDLFAGTREITIGHGGEVYRLRLTAQNKLILTK